MKTSTAQWAIDQNHSEITFKVKHMMISTVSGYFKNFTATVETDNDQFNQASIHFSAQVNSIDTKNADRDAHLRSDDFFNAEQFPEIVFNSTSFDGTTLVGNLTIRDITREVQLDVDFNGIAVDPYGQTKAGFELRGEISRKEFGLKWNAITEAGSVVVAEKVKLELDVQFIKQ